MHFLSTTLLALAVSTGVIAVPLGISYDKVADLDATESANKGRLDAGTTLAHTQVTTMREGLNKYKAGEEKATELYEASFGNNADVISVGKNIEALETGTLKAKVATHHFTDGEIASVPWEKDDEKKNTMDRWERTVWSKISWNHHTYG